MIKLLIQQPFLKILNIVLGKEKFVFCDIMNKRVTT